MDKNLVYVLRQDGSICGGSASQDDVANIQELVVDQNWSQLLSRREHRIVDPIKLSSKFNAAPTTKTMYWRMELFPLKGHETDTPAFSCMLQCIDVEQVNSNSNEIASLRTIIDAMPFGVAVIKRDKHVYIMNQAALNLAGYSNMEEFHALQKPCQETFCPAPQGQCPVWDKGQLFDKTERPFLMRDGTTLQVLKSAVPITIEGETMMLEGVIDLRKQKDLERLAYSDPLTGILNRKGLREKFKILTEHPLATQKNFTVMMLDLDDFKAINDTYGHFAGDSVLRFFVQSMKKELHKDDIFCRWGGDEFLIITAAKIQSCVQLVTRVIDHTKIVPFESEGWDEISLNFSAGLAAFELGMTLDQIVHQADGYMYQAKRNRLGIAHADVACS